MNLEKATPTTTHIEDAQKPVDPTPATVIKDDGASVDNAPVEADASTGDASANADDSVMNGVTTVSYTHLTLPTI